MQRFKICPQVGNKISVKTDKYQPYFIRKEEKKASLYVNADLCTSANVYMQTAFIYVS